MYRNIYIYIYLHTHTYIYSYTLTNIYALLTFSAMKAKIFKGKQLKIFSQRMFLYLGKEIEF